MSLPALLFAVLLPSAFGAEDPKPSPFETRLAATKAVFNYPDMEKKIRVLQKAKNQLEVDALAVKSADAIWIPRNVVRDWAVLNLAANQFLGTSLRGSEFEEDRREAAEKMVKILEDVYEAAEVNATWRSIKGQVGVFRAKILRSLGRISEAYPQAVEAQALYDKKQSWTSDQRTMAYLERGFAALGLEKCREAASAFEGALKHWDRSLEIRLLILKNMNAADYNLKRVKSLYGGQRTLMEGFASEAKSCVPEAESESSSEPKTSPKEK